MTFPASLLLLASILPAAIALRTEITVEVRPKSEECFFVPIADPGKLTLEYQVLDSQGLQGQLAEMSISTRVVAPMEKLATGGHGAPILVAETKREAGLHTFDISAAGDYKICFDNRFSYVNTKIVYIFIETDEDESVDLPPVDFEVEEKYLEDAEEINEKLAKIKNDLMLTHNLQNKIKATNTKDRSMAENNFQRVNMTSVFYILLILGAGFLQTVLVKNLFEEPHKLHPVWRKAAQVLG
jgi:hypothetical protein